MNFHVPAAAITTTTTTADPKALARSQKLFGASLVKPHGTSQGLEQIKQSLLREIKTKLQEQIESKQLECHRSEGEAVAAAEAVATLICDNSHNQPEQRRSVDGEATSGEQEVNKEESNNSTTTPQPDDSGSDGNGTKRFSICSLSGVELRKRYSPVYERTRKIVRLSSGSINRLSSSQPRVVVPQQRTGGGGPNSPSASVGTEGTATVLSPVTSKGDLEEEALEFTEKSVVANQDSKEVTKCDSNSVASSRQNVAMNSSNTRIGQYSAHPSVYVIEQEDRSRIGGSTGLDESRSDKMDRSTSTLKRGASFKGLRKNIKKVGSTFHRSFNIPIIRCMPR